MNSEELLKIIDVLNNIRVPTILIESVALPIRNCAAKLEKMYQEEMSKKNNIAGDKVVNDGDAEVYVGDKPPEV